MTVEKAVHVHLTGTVITQSEVSSDGREAASFTPSRSRRCEGGENTLFVVTAAEPDRALLYS